MIIPLLLALVAAGAASAATLQGGPARTGQVHALTIFARFADERDLGAEIPTWGQEIFAAQRPGSLTHFYNEMSRGQYALTGAVLPRWYASRRDAAAYTDGEGGFGDFSREILAAVDADIDLGLYDNDGPD
ncbi:MAG: hypothetical protein QGH25_20550, partial [Candidatus Latescibacteria bacterium]|nr:hypothetical protein [Candidatus Latescibacterota bacterium]